MAKKGRQHQRKRSGNRGSRPGAQRQPNVATTPPATDHNESVAPDVDDAGELVTSGAAPSAVTTAAAGAGARRVQRRDPASQGRGRSMTSSSAAIAPLDTTDAAIPFDRVPYVPADLRRVLVMALLMVILIVIADVLVTNLVK